MLGKFRVGGLLASVCLVSMLSGTTVFAQEAESDDVVVDTVDTAQPAQDVPAVGIDEPGSEEPAEETAAVDEPEPVVEAFGAVAEFAPTVTILPMMYIPKFENNFEKYTDEELQTAVKSAEKTIAQLEKETFMFCGETRCKSDGDFPYYKHNMFYQYEIANQRATLASLNDEIRSRVKIAEVAPKVAESAEVVTAAENGKPPREFCAALAASGDRSDCGWSYKQSQ